MLASCDRVAPVWPSSSLSPLGTQLPAFSTKCSLKGSRLQLLADWRCRNAQHVCSEYTTCRIYSTSIIDASSTAVPWSLWRAAGGDANMEETLRTRSQGIAPRGSHDVDVQHAAGSASFASLNTGR